MTRAELGGIHTLKPEVEAIVAAAESAGGKPIDFRLDDTLATAARTTIATGRAKASLVVLNPARTEVLDLTIARECGVIARVLSAPPGDRRVARTSAAARVIARDQLGPETTALAPAVREEKLAGWIDAFVLRLTTLPTRISVESALYWEYPALHEDQARALGAEAQELARDVAAEGDTPPSMVRMRAMLTYTFFRTAAPNISRKWTTGPAFPRVAVSMGQRLVKLTEERRPGLAGDIALADAWADALGVRNWYEWVPL